MAYISFTKYNIAYNSKIRFFQIWFKFFLKNIPPTRTVLVIEDGHSHISLEAIKLAQDNDVHLLCLPSHTTHILQPLDISVFKPFKSFFNKACKNFLFSNPGQVIKSENLAHLYQSPGQKL